MEVIKKDELQELLDVVRVNPYGTFLIIGDAGCGMPIPKFKATNFRRERLCLVIRVQ